jgi:hypothetical protein
VDLIFGRELIDAGYVEFSDPDDGKKTINDLWRFKDVSDNLKIQGYVLTLYEIIHFLEVLQSNVLLLERQL